MGIKFPTPWKTLVIKFPPPRDGKSVKCPGYARGGMLKLRFDQYITELKYALFHHCVSRNQKVVSVASQNNDFDVMVKN